MPSLLFDDTVDDNQDSRVDNFSDLEDNDSTLSDDDQGEVEDFENQEPLDIDDALEEVGRRPKSPRDEY